MNRCWIVMLLVSVAYSEEWCPHEAKWLEGYTGGGDGIRFSTLEAAAAECPKHGSECGGITMNSPGVYTLRRGRTLNDSPYGEVSYVREASCSGDKQEWCPHEGKWLEGYTSGNAIKLSTLEAAAAECINYGSECGGITKEQPGVFTLRRGSTLNNSPSGEVSYLREASCPDYTERLLSQGMSTAQGENAHGASGRAVDGSYSGNWWDGSCIYVYTPAPASADNWWTVSLGGAKRIARVVITSRTDCCQAQLDGTKVYVDNHYCGAVVYTAGVAKFTVQCNNAVGSVVKLVHNENYLTLCEVEVYGSDSRQ